MLGLIAMPQQWNQLPVVATQRPGCLSTPVHRLDNCNLIVGSAQPALPIALDVRGIACGPVCPRSRIAQKMERWASQRVTAFERFLAARIQRNTGFGVILSRFNCDGGAACCERKPGLV